jgi:hypothetical protein
MRTVVADDREMHVARKALRGESAGECTHAFRDLAPGPRLPDPEVLLAHGRMLAALLRVTQQEPRERV